MDQLSDDQRQDVGHISKAGRHLLELINEVLDISRIESGQMTMSPEPVAIDDLASELLALVGPLARAAGVTMPQQHEPCGAYVFADRQRLKQVMLNLLSNAVKYNREGGSITLHCAPSGDDRFRIAITDTGYGIAPAQLDLLFRPFERLGAEQTAVEGTGMGLALSKGFVEAMGGSIGVDSTVEVGSTFWIELALTEGPIERYERKNAGTAQGPASRHSQRVILHIEDNLSNQNLVERILERRPGTQLLVALQGRAGVDLARERRPDVILLDLHLPDISGLEVLRLLKAHSETRQIPVVILSADVDASRTARLTAAGAFGYLTKPLHVASFLELVDRAVNADDPVVPS
jgi:CheY-like chemotaxis protein